MNQDTDKFTQYLAVFLIVFGATAMGIAAHFRWSDLSTAAAGIIGGGLGIITSPRKANVAKADQVNIDQSGAK